MRTFSGIVLIIVIGLTLGACSRDKGRTVATVDGTAITSSDLVAEMRLEKENYDPALLHTESSFGEFRRMTLDRLVQQAILLAEAKRLGLKATDEEIAQSQPENPELKEKIQATLAERNITPARWHEAQRRRLLIEKLIGQEVVDKIPVSDAQVEAYFKDHPQEFHENTQFHARQILVSTREEADRIHARLAKGEDFAELARRFSLSPDAKRGGDLGFFDARAYPEAFANICQQLAIGQTSDVVATPYGYQIFQLLDKRPARQQPLSEVKAQIKKHLQEEKIEEAFQPWLAGLREKSKVVIDDAALKEVRLEG